MRIFGGDRMKGWLEMMRVPDDEAIEHKMISRTIESAQKRVEGYHFDTRKHLVEYDDVMNKHREVIYKRRYKALSQVEDISAIEDSIKEMLASEARHFVGQHASGNPSEWNLEQLVKDVATLIVLSPEQAAVLQENLAKLQSDAAVEVRVKDLFLEAYDAKKADMGEAFAPLIRQIYLQTIDMLWREHLTTMQELRNGIGLQAYSQTDPLVIYKAEGYRLFQQLLLAIDSQTTRTLFRIQRLENIPAPAPTTEALIG